MGDLVFIGDAHLERDDPHLPAFLDLLEALSRTAERIVFVGDLFNLWIGQRELEAPHQTAVVTAMVDLRGRGLVLDYLEGNRDFRIAPCYGGRALDRVAKDGLELDFGGRRIWAVHGDLANPADWRYRTWRAFCRTAFVWTLFGLVPRTPRLRLAEAVERRMRRTNAQFRREFPESSVRAYGRSLLGGGRDGVVLGHFHVEKTLTVPAGKIYVLPEWRSSRRHLRVTPSGEIAFVDSGR